MNGSLGVAEIFYSVQGEGHTLGTPAYFIRLAGCNLMCGGYGTEKDNELHNGATWRCDSIEVWRKGIVMTFEEIVKLLNLDDLRSSGAHIVFTGGEPLLQQQGIMNFLRELAEIHKCYPIIEVETNGTIIPNDFMLANVDYWNCSPKLENSGMELNERIKINALLAIAHCERAMFKFVVTCVEDWDEIVSYYLPHINRSQIYLMPGADNQWQLNEMSPWLIEFCKSQAIKFSTRLHITVWNQKTGV